MIPEILNSKLSPKAIVIFILMLTLNVSCSEKKEESDCECRKGDGSIASVYKNNKLFDIYGKEVDLNEIPERAVSLV